MRHRGFTLIELLVTIGLFVGIFLVAIPSISKLAKHGGSSPPELLAALLVSSARHARDGDQASAWGVYLPYDDVTRTAGEIIVFSGDSYVARDASRDLAYSFDDTVLFTSVDLSGDSASSGNDHEIVFSALTGETSQHGTISLLVRGQTASVVVSPSGFPTTP